MRLPFRLNEPSKSYKLGKKYKEISGICLLPDSDAMAFVQDEKICVHTLNLRSEEVGTTAAGRSGDAEDLVVIGRTAYVLVAGEKPSIYEFTDYRDSDASIECHELELAQADEPEGLCHDVDGERLLIACKGSAASDDRTRRVLSFDLQTRSADTESAVLEIDSDRLGLHHKTFHPSGIAIHPQTNDIYLVGTKDVKMIVCCGRDGSIKGAAELNKRRFEQPEGLTFSDSGELFICSEGKKKKARIERFSPE